MSDVADDSVVAEVASEALNEVQAVLLSLGYSLQEAKAAIKQACRVVDKKDSSEDILKEALSYLSQD